MSIKTSARFLLCWVMYYFPIQLSAQVTPAPGKTLNKPILFQNAVIHTGTGEAPIIGDLIISEGKIIKVGSRGNAQNPGSMTIVDLAGKHIYPGFIAVNSDIGLEEIEAVRATRDAQETGSINPNARSIIAYNADSKVTPTHRANGVLTAQIAPKGGVFSGTSSIVQLDAWNYEDAVIVKEDAVYLNWFDTEPSFSPSAPPLEEQKKNILQAETELHTFMKNALAFASEQGSEKNARHNLLYSAMIPVLKKEKPLFIRASTEKQILSAIAFGQQYNLRIVIAGAQEAYTLLDLLKKSNIPLVLFKPHQLPYREDDPVDLPYRLPALLENAGIPYCFDMDVFWNERNLPFQAGTAAAYGINPEQALKALTLYPAQILGIEKQTGTLEPGKDATLFISEGDALDMRTSKITDAFIQGRKISLENIHTDLFRKFQKRYE